MGGTRSSSSTRISGTLYHGTLPETANRILDEGFREGDRLWGQVFGPGVYLAPSIDEARQWGQPLAVDVDLRRVIDIDMADVRAQDEMTGMSTPELLVRRASKARNVTVPRDLDAMIRSPERWSRYLQSLGFDAIRVRDDAGWSGGNQIVVLDPSRIREVRRS